MKFKVLLLVCLLVNLFAKNDFVVSAINKNIHAIERPEEAKKNKVYKGLFLIEPHPRYAKFYVDLWTTEKALQYNATDGMRPQDFEGYFAHLAKKQAEPGIQTSSYTWFVSSEETGEIIATVGINDADPVSKFGYICYAVAPQYEHRGIATKSLYLLLEKAFEELGFEKILSTVAIGNEASDKMMKRFHFTQEGTLKRHYVVGGGVRKDFKIYSIFREEWLKIKKDLKTR